MCVYLYNVYIYTLHIYHIFFICSSVYGHLGCFHVLAIVYTSTMVLMVLFCALTPG